MAIDALIVTDNHLNTLTGIPSLTLLDAIEKQFLRLETALSVKNQSLLSARHRIMLTCMILKMNLNYASVAVFFEITSETVKSIFTKSLLLLKEILHPVIKFPPKEEIMKNIPQCFEKYSETRIVLDCTETPIQKTKCSQCRLHSYSNYKGTHTVKFLIGTAPSGLITFVSRGFGGRASDKRIVMQSKLLDLLSPHDGVMVDKGFLIETECHQRKLKLIRPPFLRKKLQFSKEEANNTVSIAAARVHVERSIQRLKILKILKGPIPAHLRNYVNCIIIIIAGIVNLSAPILKSDKF